MSIFENLTWSGLEIERKYLLARLPPRALDVAGALIEQGWLPGGRIRERIRCTRHGDRRSFSRTVKFGTGLCRTEYQEKITPEIFSCLWPLTEGCRVRKRRYRLQMRKFVWEIDDFLDQELFLAEVELESQDTKVVIPEWLKPHIVREVTDEPSYTNLSLAS